MRANQAHRGSLAAGMGVGGMGGMGGTGGTGGTGTSMGSGLALSGLPSGPGGPLLPASAAPGPSAGDGSMPPPGTFAPFTTVPLGRTHVVIERFLAEGGFAHVYLVQVADTQQRAVLKRIVCPEESDLDEQRIEADVHRRVSGHKNIVRFIDSSITPLRTGGYEILILMEYCEGGHLVDFLNTRLESRLSEDEILRVFSDVCEAVVHMHEMQPAHIHRDIKIENVLIAGNGTCKLCDFGSCTTRVVPANAQLTSQDIRRLEDEISKFTTLQYRAPEMCDLYQKRGLCEKVDTWAMGILLFKLCYFTTPFEDGGKLAILNARYNLPSFPVYSQRLKSLINSLLEVDVPKRFNIFQAYAVVCELRGVTYNLKTPPLPSKNERALNDQDPSRPVGQFASGKDGSASFGNLVGSIQTIGAVNTSGVTPMRRGRPAKATADSTVDLSSSTGAAALASAAFAPTISDPFTVDAVFGPPSTQLVSSPFSADPFQPTQAPSAAPVPTSALAQLSANQASFGDPFAPPAHRGAVGGPATLDQLQISSIQAAFGPLASTAGPTSTPTHLSLPRNASSNGMQMQPQQQLRQQPSSYLVGTIQQPGPVSAPVSQISPHLLPQSQAAPPPLQPPQVPIPPQQLGLRPNPSLHNRPSSWGGPANWAPLAPSSPPNLHDPFAPQQTGPAAAGHIARPVSGAEWLSQQGPATALQPSQAASSSPTPSTGSASNPNRLSGLAGDLGFQQLQQLQQMQQMQQLQQLQQVQQVQQQIQMQQMQHLQQQIQQMQIQQQPSQPLQRQPSVKALASSGPGRDGASQTQPVLHRQPSIKTMAPASASAKTASGNPPTVVGDD